LIDPAFSFSQITSVNPDSGHRGVFGVVWNFSDISSAKHARGLGTRAFIRG
jgi:hypothetical protein